MHVLGPVMIFKPPGLGLQPQSAAWDPELHPPRHLLAHESDSFVFAKRRGEKLTPVLFQFVVLMLLRI